MMKITKAEDMVASENFQAVIYGLAGSGKTDLLRWLPRPLLLFDFDGKAHPLMGQKDIDIVSYRMDNADQAKAMLPMFWKDVVEVRKKNEYATVVVDSITALNRMVFRWAMAMSGKPADDKGTLPIYGDMKRWYSTFFPSLVGMKSNIILLAHEQAKEDNGALMSIGPLITGKMAEELPSIFPNTFHLEYLAGSNERWRLHYRKHKKYVSSSSVFSEGEGYIEYVRNENVYEKLMKVIGDQAK
jgi:phage nucleotide-binding protein